MCTWAVVTCGLYVALEGLINFWHVHDSNTFPVIWSWWCHQRHYCIFLLEVIVYRYYMTFCTIASAGAGISVICHWQCHWYHMILLPVGSHDPKSHIASHFNHLDIWNLMDPLTVLSASCDANALPMVSDDQTCHVALHFDHYKLWNAMLSLMTPLASCDAGPSASGMPLPNVMLYVISVGLT